MDHFLEPSKLAPVLRNLQSQGKKAVFTNGVFDLLHLGHVTYLQEARKQGDLLVVGLNSDASVRRIKGPLKPLLPLAERAEMLLALECVDYTTFFEEENPYNIIKILRPDILVKGGDWAVDKIIGGDLVQSWGGKVMNIPVVEGRSTTNLIQMVVERFGSKE
ncbi:MAG TPA: D-glycero-beta-D-manno-heptose 1-phosphate adenylyltransferase [bacterium]|nr:D-glycero-beta-D-manno-heptose 1-phosphate adenylyltransferase [bacterium]